MTMNNIFLPFHFPSEGRSSFSIYGRDKTPSTCHFSGYANTDKHKVKWWWFMVIILLITGLSHGLKAQEISSTQFYPLADTWVRSSGTDKDLNYGSDTTFMSRHSTSAYNEIAFLKFDLTGYSLPQDEVIDSVQLVLTMIYNQGSGAVVNILPMNDNNDNWNENTITWNTGRPDTVHGAAPIASLPVARLNPAVTSTSGLIYSWNITSQVLTELSDSNRILSLAVFPNYKTDINIRFLSRESAAANLRPHLVIYSHTIHPNCFDLKAVSDLYNAEINLSWKTATESSVAYFNVMHATDSTNFIKLAKVSAQGSSADTVPYQFSHRDPQQNKIHFYRIETVLKDSSRNMSAFVNAAYGITGPISRNQWLFTQVPSMDITRARLMQSLQMTDYNPVGLRANPGIPLVVHVDQISGTGLPKLMVGTYDRESVTTYDLQLGDNTINNANGGDLYIKYSSDNASEGNQVKVTFQSGFQQTPLYIFGKTTHQQWLEQLATDTSAPNVTMIANRVFIVVSKESALQYKTANQDTLLNYMDEIMKAEDAISGLDYSSPVHAPAYGNKLMLLEKASGNPDATSYGRVRIPTGSIRWILDPTYISDGEGGWGIFHEIGHHHQQYPWSWSACTEVTVNIYSMAAKRFFHPGSMGMASSDWDKTMQYLEDTASDKNYNTSANYVKLGLWNQLGMAFGDSFYHKLHKRTRDEKIVPSGDAAEIRHLMLYACEISGKDLTTFFKRWNLPVDNNVYQEIAALNLPMPTTDPSDLRENWAVRVAREGDPDRIDSVILNGSAYGPAGVQKVEFFADGTKIGQSTTRPFTFVWKNVPAGSHTVVLKATGKDNAVITSDPLTIVQKAVSISYPLDNSSFTSGSTIDIRAIIASTTGISKVEFYANGNKIGESATAPYHYNWQASQDGLYAIKARVLYQAGGQDQSTEIGVGVGAYLPEADAYVRDGGNKNVNFGKDSILVVKKDISGYNRISFLKFVPDNFSGASDSIRLTLHINAANSNVLATQWQLWLCHDSNWKEQEITWNNQPGTDSLLGTIDSKKTGTVFWTIHEDIQDLLTEDGTLTLAIVGTTVNGTSDASFFSSNAATISNRPQLEIFKGIMSAAALPVEFSPLQATLSNKQVTLSWKAYSVNSSTFFTIEHSNDGKIFSKAGSQTVVSGTHNYRFTHTWPSIGLNYYRLKEEAKNGTRHYSNVVVVNYAAGGETVFKMYPNPAERGKNVVLEVPEDAKTDLILRVFNASGQLAYQRVVAADGSGRISFPTSGLPAGIYFVQLNSASKSASQYGKIIGQTDTLIIK